MGAREQTPAELRESVYLFLEDSVSKSFSTYTSLSLPFIPPALQYLHFPNIDRNPTLKVVPALPVPFAHSTTPAPMS
jgi:hypothetical protein